MAHEARRVCITRASLPSPLVAGLAAAAQPAGPAEAAAHPRGAVPHEARGLARGLAGRASGWSSPSPSRPTTRRRRSSDLWIVPADGSAPPRRLTSSKGGESAPAWSPDSRRVAFSAKREDDEVAQIYVIDVAGGGEARRVTSSPLAARSPVWSPDGRSIALPERGLSGRGGRRGEQEDRRGAEGREVEGPRLRDLPHPPLGQVAGRHPDPPLRGLRRRRGRAARPARGHRLVAMPGFGGPGGEGSTRGPRARPGRPTGSIVFVATTNRNASAYAPVNSHLFEVPVARRRAAALTTGNAIHGEPRLRARRPVALLPRRARSGERSTRSAASPARRGRGAARSPPSPRPSTARWPTSPSPPTAGRSTSPPRTPAS